MLKHEVESALDQHHVWGAMRNGRWWKVRRNGQTKLWKTRPDDWSIPVKAGLKSHAYLTQESTFGLNADFVISDTDPNVKPKKWTGQSIGDELVSRVLPRD